jgi:hypothetical protein
VEGAVWEVALLRRMVLDGHIDRLARPVVALHASPALRTMVMPALVGGILLLLVVVPTILLVVVVYLQMLLHRRRPVLVRGQDRVDIRAPVCIQTGRRGGPQTRRRRRGRGAVRADR